MEETKINCIGCKNLWIAVAVAIVIITLTGIGIFNFNFYVENKFKIFDILRFSGLGLGIIFFGWGSQYQLRKYCFGTITEKGDLERLFLGISAIVVFAVLIMVGLFYTPMAIQEIGLRSLIEQYDNNLFGLSNVTDAIQQLDCNTFLSHYSSYEKSFHFEDKGFFTESFLQKYIDCKKWN